MVFFEFSKPNYSTDFVDRKLNPINLIEGVELPSIICDECSDTWAGSNRIRVDNTKANEVKLFLSKNKIPRFVSINNWFDIKKEIATLLDDIDANNIEPGATIGAPIGEVLNENLEDITHPFPGQMWVNSKVVNVLIENNVKGANFVKVDIIGRDIDLWELDIYGKAWRNGMDKEKITACKKCSRFIFPTPDYLKVDIDRWDGSDIFNLDLNPNIVITNERTCKILKDNRIKNFECIPI